MATTNARVCCGTRALLGLHSVLLKPPHWDSRLLLDCIICAPQCLTKRNKTCCANARTQRASVIGLTAQPHGLGHSRLLLVASYAHRSASQGEQVLLLKCAHSMCFCHWPHGSASRAWPHGYHACLPHGILPHGCATAPTLITKIELSWARTRQDVHVGFNS